MLCYTRLRTVPRRGVLRVVPLLVLPLAFHSPNPGPFPVLPVSSPVLPGASLPIPSGLARGGWDALVAVAARRGIGMGRAKPTACHCPGRLVPAPYHPTKLLAEQKSRIRGFLMLCSQPDALSRTL